MRAFLNAFHKQSAPKSSKFSIYAPGSIKGFLLRRSWNGFGGEILVLELDFGVLRTIFWFLGPNFAFWGRFWGLGFWDPVFNFPASIFERFQISQRRFLNAF